VTGKTSPVTASVLGWAVEEDGRDFRELAEALDIDPDVLDSWLAGEAKPTQGQVTNLAKLLKRPRALFFLPKPPLAATLPASFRHPPGDERLVSPSVRRRVRQARRVQQAVSWALRDGPIVDVPRGHLGTAPEALAQSARDWLGVSTEEQAAWRSDYDALNGWRHTLESRHLLVFSLDLGRGDVRGFSAWDDRAPLIVTNSAGINPAARCFTLMHELGHLFLREDATCIESGPEGEVTASVEAWCERFAAVVLMPATATEAWARSQNLQSLGAGIDEVRAMMTRFRVSARAAALRLIALGFAPRSLYGEVNRVFAPRETPVVEVMSSPPRSVLRQRQFGDQVLRTILNDLPPRDALSILRLEVEDTRRLAELVPGVRGV
jgi:Zn-dependent peptidase ImmA (M78 family)